MNPYQYACSKFEGDLIKPYQSEGVRWMMVRERDCTPGGILCDEMGLGKTAQTICTILADTHHTNTLILCPKSVVEQWAAELFKFAPCLREHVLIYGGPQRTRDPEVLKTYKVVISSLGMVLPRKEIMVTTLHGVNWHRVVIDEAHDMRNRKSLTFIHVNALKARIRWCLTGTPVFNKIGDFVTLMAWIGIPRQHVQAGLKACVDRYVIRRTKEEVSEHNETLRLPPCIVENVMVKINEHEAELYDQLFTKGQLAVKRSQTSQNAGMYIMEILEAYLRCRQCLAYPDLITRIDKKKWEHNCTKIDVLMTKLDQHPTEKTLIFCNFRGEMDVIQERANRHVYRIDGSYSQHDRNEQIKMFNEDSTGSIFVIQIKAGGVGLNLQNATRVYITSPAWNPATEIQAIGRSHRTGQKNTVRVCRLITEDVDDRIGSIEKTLIRLQEAKSQEFSKLMSNVGEMGKLPRMGNPDLKALTALFNKPTPEQSEEIDG